MWTSHAVDAFRKEIQSTAPWNSLLMDNEEAYAEVAPPRKPGIKKVPIHDDQVAPLIAPGGVYGDKEVAPVKSKRERPKVSTYDEAFPGLIPQPESGGFRALQAPVVQGPKSEKQHEATHNRCVAHEAPADWRRHLQTSSVLNSATEDALASASRAQHRRQGIGREDHERRWRRWLKQKEKEEQGAPSTVTGTVTEASTIPAGMRPAKCMGDSFPDGVRIPLFGEDIPKPVWTTLATAPWVGVPKEPQRKSAKVETPWTSVEDDPTHPLQGKVRLGGSSTARASRATPSVARSGAQSARGSLPESRGSRPEDPAGAAFSPVAQANKKRGIAVSATQVKENGPFTQPWPSPRPVVHEYMSSPWFDDKVTLPQLQQARREKEVESRPWGDYPVLSEKPSKTRPGVLGYLTPRKTSDASSAVKVKAIGS